MSSGIIFYCKLCGKPYTILINEAKIREFVQRSGRGIITITTLHLSTKKPHIVKLHVDQHGFVRSTYYKYIDISDVFAWSIPRDVHERIANTLALAQEGIRFDLDIEKRESLEELLEDYLGTRLENVRVIRDKDRIHIETDLDEIDPITKTLVEIIVMKIVERNQDKNYVVRYLKGSIEIEESP